MQLKLYAVQDGLITSERTKENIGYTLNDTRVLASGVSEGTDAVVCFIYYLFIGILYSFGLLAFYVYHRKDSKKHKLKQYVKHRKHLIKGIICVASLSIAAEFVTRFVRTIEWTAYARGGNAVSIFLLIWLSQIIFGVFVITPNIITHSIGIYLAKQDSKKRSADNDLRLANINDREVGSTRPSPDEHNPNTSDSTTSTTSSDDQVSEEQTYHSRYTVHIILVVYLFFFYILYSFFPAFILVFAYPTKVVAIVAFIIAFIFSLIVLIASSSYFYHRYSNGIIKFLVFHILPVIFIGAAYFYATLFVLLYVLIIGRASVITTGPLAAISLLPSLLLSGLAWIIKKVVFPSQKNSSSDVECQTDPPLTTETNT